MYASAPPKSAKLTAVPMIGGRRRSAKSEIANMVPMSAKTLMLRARREPCAPTCCARMDSVLSLSSQRWL